WRLPGQHRLHRRCCALERDMRDLNSVIEVEQPDAGEMRRSTVAGTGVAVLAGIGLEHRDQLLEVLHRERWMHDDHFWRRNNDCHRHKAPERGGWHFRLDDWLSDKVPDR